MRDWAVAADEIKLETENANLRLLLQQAGIDAEQHKVADELHRILLEELHHRVKNNLAIVQAIVSQSLRSASNVEQGGKAIESRLAALGRVHDLLLRTNWGTAKLADLLRVATEPFDTPGAGQFLIQSTNINVASAAALPLAMTLNELCTNAVKYGALTSAKGRVKITTKVDKRAEQFRLTWAETGGPLVQEPTQRNFGMRLIEKSFVSQLQGSAQVKFEPSGVVCNLDVPLAALRAPTPDKGTSSATITGST